MDGASGGGFCEGLPGAATLAGRGVPLLGGLLLQRRDPKPVGTPSPPLATACCTRTNKLVSEAPHRGRLNSGVAPSHIMSILTIKLVTNAVDTPTGTPRNDK